MEQDTAKTNYARLTIQRDLVGCDFSKIVWP
jgi:hypothetical protein